MLFLMLNEGVDEIHGEQNNYTIRFKVHACEGWIFKFWSSYASYRDGLKFVD